MTLHRAPATARTAVDWATLVSFSVGTDLLAAPVEAVERVLRWSAPAVVAQLPEWTDGVITYNGRVVRVVDLRRRFGRAHNATTAATRTIVFAVAGEWMAAVVDSVQDVISVDATTIAAPPPAVRGLSGEYLLGVVERNGRAVLVLDIARLLSATEPLELQEAQP